MKSLGSLLLVWDSRVSQPKLTLYWQGIAAHHPAEPKQPVSDVALIRDCPQITGCKGRSLQLQGDQALAQPNHKIELRSQGLVIGQ